MSISGLSLTYRSLVSRSTKSCVFSTKTRRVRVRVTASSVPQPKLNILRPLHSPLCHSPHPVKDTNHSQAGAAGAGCWVSRSPRTQDLRPGAKAERLPSVHQTARAEGTNGFSDAPSHGPFSSLPCQTFPSQSTEVTLGSSLSLPAHRASHEVH